MIEDPDVDGLRLDWADGIAHVTLDRPATRNAMTIAMRRGLIGLIRAADADPDTRLMLLTGTDPAFSSGVDLTEAVGGGSSPRGARTDPAAALRAATTPVVAVVNGPCYTGALEVALSCSFIIASDRARFADTHAMVGLLPGWGMSALLPAAVGTRLARRMMLTGEPIDAEQALAAGLVTEVVPHAELQVRAGEIAGEMTNAHPGAAAAVLDLLDRGDGVSVPHALTLERDAALRWRTDPAEVARRFAARA